jgi:hypothetical protein
MMMATRLEGFPDEDSRGQQQRKYPWDEWTDGGTWEIRQTEDYDVATENMRVNLHMKASSQARKVKTKRFSDENGEGLIFQFLDPQDPDSESRPPVGGDTDPDGSIELLYRDALEIYEVARREVTIPRRDGTRQKYAAVRYKQQIERAYSKGELVSAITRIISRRTEGFGHLEEANRPDLMVESLVLDTSKPYHRLFSSATVDTARARMAEYAARHAGEMK